jgi:hypothetical protein
MESLSSLFHEEFPHHGPESHELRSRITQAPITAESIRSQHASLSDVAGSRLLAAGDEDESELTGFINSLRDSHDRQQWTPFALRWYFIMIPALLAMTFTVVVAFLYKISAQNNGLGPEDSAISGWRFIPTFVAVVYTQLTIMVLGAMKRTEPYARLSRAPDSIPIARYTLLEKPKPWWTTLLHGFQKERNGGSRNWAIVASCIVYILAILGVSPISATLLSSKQVQKGNTESFVRLALRNDSAHPLHPRAKRDTYLQTTGAILKNYSTSPWITDDYLIMPFWPSHAPQVESPWNFRSLEADSWEANTTVFRNDFVCTDLRLNKTEVYLRHRVISSDLSIDESHYNKTYVASILLDSDHGCHFNMTVNMTKTYRSEESKMHVDWISWGDSHRIMFADAYSEDAIVRLNEQCREDEIILMSTPWWLYTNREKLYDNITIRAYACHSDHTMADIPVRILGEPGRQSVQFDESLFDRVRTPITSATINIQELNDIYNSVAWSDFIPQKPLSGMKEGYFGGSAAMLGRGYNFSIPEMMADPNLLVSARRFRRRFFAEVVGAALQHDTASVSQQHHIAGVSYLPSRQVIVSGQAAYVLCSLLAVSFCALLGIIWWVRPSKRKLGLYYDPSMVLGVAQWASSNRDVLSEFRTLDLSTRQSMKEILSNRKFATREGGLHDIGDSTDPVITPPDQVKAQATGKAKKDTSIVLPELRLRNIACLLLYVSGLLVAMVVLFQLAQRSQLHQAFFTYRADVVLFGDETTISPFALVPTLLAVVISLWWESINSTCRSAQPYISMCKGAAAPSQSTGLSYASSFWLWTSIKALKNRHWLLSLVGATSFLIQICRFTFWPLAPR